jgi:hypothetical protein
MTEASQWPLAHRDPDPRDQVLLEFEQRIFSNLKNDGNPPPLVAEDVIPGYFRTTDYSQAEVNQILGESFLTWVGANKLDYTSQTYVSANEFTYNYSQAGNRLDQQPLLGAWRGIYRYFYDTPVSKHHALGNAGFSVNSLSGGPTAMVQHLTPVTTWCCGATLKPV